MIKTNGIWQLNRDPSCLAYYDADVGNVVLNAGNVSLWRNSSSIYTESARDAVQSTAINQPAYTQSDSDFAGHGSIYFGSGTLLQSTTFSAALAQPVTYYAAIRLSSAATGTCALMDGIGTAGLRQMIYFTNGVPTIFAGTVVNGSGDYKNQTVILCAVFNGANSALYLNNTSTPVITGNPGAQSIDGITLGNSSTNSNPFIGYVGCFAAIGRASSGTEIQSVMRHLGMRYGGAVT